MKLFHIPAEHLINPKVLKETLTDCGNEKLPYHS